jgi:hypothetical protein
MTSLSRSVGFTLVELLVALTLGMVLVAIGARISQQAFFVERAEGERAGLTATLRTGAAYLVRELESVGADSLAGGDLDSTAAGLTLRAQRGLRISCRLAVDTVLVEADTALDWSARAPAPGRDSLLLYSPGDSTAPIDAWVPLPLVAVRNDRCPSGAPALALATLLDSTTMARRRLPPRTAVRLFESIAIRAYAGALGWQLGVEGLSAAALIQPLAGPLAPSGLSFRGRDSAGSPIPLGPAAASLDLTLVGRTDRQLATGLGSRSTPSLDSVAVSALLRNR